MEEGGCTFAALLLTNFMISLDSYESNHLCALIVQDASVDAAELLLLCMCMQRGRLEIPALHASIDFPLMALDFRGCNMSFDRIELLISAIHHGAQISRIWTFQQTRWEDTATRMITFTIAMPLCLPWKEYLSNTTALTTLNLCYCGLGMHSTIYLADAMRTNNSLTRVDLSSNSLWWDEKEVDEIDSDQHFDTKAHLAIAKMLIDKSGGGNLSFMKIGATVLEPAELFLAEKIDFKGKRISRTDTIVIAACLAENTALTRLSFAGCSIRRRAQRRSAECSPKESVG